MNKTVFLIYQYDIHFTERSKVLFGIFTTKTEAQVERIMLNGFESLYPGFKKDVYPSGTMQWMTDKFDFGVSIEKVELNIFGEV